MHINATWFAASSSKARSAQLSFSSGDLQVKELAQATLVPATNDTLAMEKLTVSYPLAELSLSPPLANLPREITLPGGGKIVVESHHPIERFFNTQKKYHLLDQLERNKKAWFLALLLVPISLFWLVKVAIPAGAKMITPLIPQSVIAQIDTQVMVLLDKTSLDESEVDSAAQKTTQLMWDTLLTDLNYKASDFSLNLRKSEFYGANAFALPGGTVVVTDELLTLLENQPNALKAVLLHEMGHVIHQHGLQMVAESAGTTLLMTYFFGDLDGGAEFFTGTALTVVQNQFSQSLESEADDYALTQLTQLSLPTSALGDALSALTKGSKEFVLFEKYFSSHPSIKQRVEKSMQQMK